ELNAAVVTINEIPTPGAANVKIGSAIIVPNGNGTVDLTAFSNGTEVLGSWGIDITYDPAVVSVTGCTATVFGAPDGQAICNPAYASNKVRVGGADSGGNGGLHTPGVLLAQITFHAIGNTGTQSNLVIGVEQFTAANGTPISY